MITQSIYTNTEYFHAFPKPDSVFASEANQYLEFLFPLASISLSIINPEWQGEIHFVLPIEPYGGEKSGVVGSDTKKYHTYLCRPNWIGYQIDDQHRYTITTDFRYFLMADLDNRTDLNMSNEMKEYLRDDYDAKRKSFAKNEKHFEENNALHVSYARRRNGRYSDNSRVELIKKIGGAAGWGNWTQLSDFPLSKINCIDEDGDPCTSPVPQAEDGSDFTFIGWLPAYNYVSDYDCNLYLFYNHTLRLALTTFDWS